ncbi:hypothetical protein GGS20DRAFT_599724 [Poronia punctata]|nr:hypothetical protein GGS20DRAFT_599724 [Poronia punctata]
MSEVVVEKGIHNLPVELLDLICDYLAADDLPNVRATCRGLNNATLERFGRKFFVESTVTLNPSSLDRLRRLSVSPFAYWVQSLTISTTRMFDQTCSQVVKAPYYYRCDDMMDRSRGRGRGRGRGRWDEGESRDRQLRIEKNKAVKDVLATTETGIAYVTHAMARFPNLRSVSIDDDLPWTRCGHLGCGWGYGLDEQEKFEARHRAFLVILIASAKSGVPLECMCFGSVPSEYPGLSPPPHPDLMRLLPFDSVKELELSVSRSSVYSYSSRDGPGWICGKPLGDFVAFFPHLRHLALITDLDWDLTGFFDNLYRPNLSVLQIRWGKCLSGALQNLLRRHKDTLRVVSLSRLTVTRPLWEEIADQIDDEMSLDSVELVDCRDNRGGF